MTVESNTLDELFTAVNQYALNDSSFLNVMCMACGVCMIIAIIPILTHGGEVVDCCDCATERQVVLSQHDEEVAGALSRRTQET